MCCDSLAQLICKSVLSSTSLEARGRTGYPRLAVLVRGVNVHLSLSTFESSPQHQNDSLGKAA